MFQSGYSFGYHRLRHMQTFSRLTHAARIYNLHENLQVPQLEAAGDALVSHHVSHLIPIWQ
jgi:hypothetical protein